MLLSRPRPACLGRIGPSRWSRNLSGQAARSSARNVGPAEAVVATINAAELSGTLSYRDHLIRIGLWSLVSLNVGAYFSQGDDGAQVLLPDATRGWVAPPGLGTRIAPLGARGHATFDIAEVYDLAEMESVAAPLLSAGLRLAGFV